MLYNGPVSDMSSLVEMQLCDGLCPTSKDGRCQTEEVVQCEAR